MIEKSREPLNGTRSGLLDGFGMVCSCLRNRSLKLLCHPGECAVRRTRFVFERERNNAIETVLDVVVERNISEVRELDAHVLSRQILQYSRVALFGCVLDLVQDQIKMNSGNHVANEIGHCAIPPLRDGLDSSLDLGVSIVIELSDN